jgi:hypothetical protein
MIISEAVGRDSQVVATCFKEGLSGPQELFQIYFNPPQFWKMSKV